MPISNIGLQEIRLDISTKLRQKTFYANEVDTKGRGLHAFLQDNGVKVNGTGVTMRLRYKSLNDGESKTWDFTPIGDPTNGEFEFHYPTEMVRGHGNKLFPCTIVANDLTSELAFENVFVYVNKAEVNTEGIEASNEHSTLRKSLDDVLIVQAQLGNITPEQINFVAVAEADRTTAETTRGNSETARVNAETGRTTAEGLRVTAESGRATAENLRTTAEATREANDLARGTYVEAIEANYAPELNGVKSQLTETASKADAMASGSPKDIYATLVALQTAYPTGTTGAYLVSADGKWYYWSGSAWTAGGVYQSSSFPEVTDVRLGADGKTYANAGEAVRGQVSLIKSDISDIEKSFNVSYVPIAEADITLYTDQRWYANGSGPTAAVGYNAYKIENVKANKKYDICGYRVGDGTCSVLFVNSSGIVFDKIANAVQVQTTIDGEMYHTRFTTPIGTVKILYTTFVTGYSQYNSRKIGVVSGISSLTDIEAIIGRDTSIVPSIVTPEMTEPQFITAFNSAMTAYASLCKCYVESFDVIKSGSLWSEIYRIVNHNLRLNIAVTGKTHARICEEINHALTKPIRRFCDAKINNGTARDFSLNTGFQADEPSVIVSDDGGTLYIYAKLKRVSTKDGVKWSTPTNLVLSDGKYIMHNNINLIDGVYYLTGCRVNLGGDLVLYTSTDGINFTYRGILFKAGIAFATGYTVDSWGNSYLVKEYGSNTLYFYVEAQSSGTSWIIHLATCTDLFYVNADGTIGNWIINPSNPVLEKPYSNISTGVSSAGNPDFAKGSDNRPIRVDGKYFMYFHSTFNSGIAHILRAYSNDLKIWTNESSIFDNRDQPTGGDATSGNADACIIEFKGRTYLFYTWDINNAAVDPYIKYTVDDRPIREVLALRP